jgi:predicted DNA-binding protein
MMNKKLDEYKTENGYPVSPELAERLKNLSARIKESKSQLIKDIQDARKKRETK